MIVVGITGTLGSGKGTIVDYLKEKGFLHFSAREYLKELVLKEKRELNRDSLTEISNKYRQLLGPDFIARGLLQKAKEKGVNCIIESIRSVSEVEYLKQNCQFFLLSVDCDIHIRYERIVLRKSETDNVSFETFVQNELRESTDQKDKQNLRAVMALADYRLDNSTTIDALNKQIADIIKQIFASLRPSWDDYFLDIVKTVSKRATCSRGRSGCVVVKDKQILVTGYVGSPIGFEHCDEVGHLLRQTIDQEGKISMHCVRTVHAEQNAICQAARRGISLDGATMYCTMTPCRTCCMMIINCGIKRVVCLNKYQQAKDSEQMFEKANIELVYKNQTLMQYE